MSSAVNKRARCSLTSDQIMDATEEALHALTTAIDTAWESPACVVALDESIDGASFTIDVAGPEDLVELVKWATMAVAGGRSALTLAPTLRPSD
ncbi:MAG TPA: hypothetical protein VGM78_07960 [Ilumatobacteraceae bacterium]